MPRSPSTLPSASVPPGAPSRLLNKHLQAARPTQGRARCAKRSSVERTAQLSMAVQREHSACRYLRGCSPATRGTWERPPSNSRKAWALRPPRPLRKPRARCALPSVPRRSRAGPRASPGGTARPAGLLTLSPAAHFAEDRVSIAVALQHETPSSVTARVSRKPCAGRASPRALQEERGGAPRDCENRALLERICPNNPQKQQESKNSLVFCPTLLLTSLVITDS